MFDRWQRDILKIHEELELDFEIDSEKFEKVTKELLQEEEEFFHESNGMIQKISILMSDIDKIFQASVVLPKTLDKNSSEFIQNCRKGISNKIQILTREKNESCLETQNNLKILSAACQEIIKDVKNIRDKVNQRMVSAEVNQGLIERTPTL
jgi:hypothetical protein